MPRSDTKRPQRAPRVCADCGTDFGLEGPLPYGHRVALVRPETVVRCVSPRHGNFEALKAELTAQAGTSEEYERAVAEAARRAGV